MTAIVGVLNSRAFAIAADSAVTVTGNNSKKVYNRSNKIFTLSKVHPVGIAIYSSADFMGIPLETAIKLYQQRLKEQSFGTIEDYKNDFLTFLQSLIPGVSNEIKQDDFYSFFGKTYHPLINSLLNKIHQFNSQGLDSNDIDNQYDRFVNEATQEQRTIIDTLPKSNYVQKTYEEFLAFHQLQLSDVTKYIQDKIREHNQLYTVKALSIQSIYELFYEMINVEWIFETFSGLVFFGFGDDDMYPVTTQVFVGSTICDIPRIRHADEVKIIPGKKGANSNIIPYAQADVTQTVLTGVDPKFVQTMESSIKESFKDVADGVGPLLRDQNQVNDVSDFINQVGDELIEKLNEFQFSAITGPLLEILTHMGKEDMAELAESLVNITSIKRKFTSSDSSDESVGGPVDDAIVTKGDGFIWIKRKHYFEIQNNPDFTDRYLKF